MATTKEQDITEMLNLSKMRFGKGPGWEEYPDEYWRRIITTPAGLFLDIVANKARDQFDIYLTRGKWSPNKDVPTIRDRGALDLFEAQCLVYDYWHRDADGTAPAEAA